MRGSLVAALGVLCSTLSVSACVPSLAEAQTTGRTPDTVVVRNGTLELRALLWRPAGPGPFPAVLFNHGSGPAGATLTPDRIALGSVFTRHGYAFLFLFRRGSGLSAQQGANSFDVMGQALIDHGADARNQVQLRLLEHDDLSDAVAGLAVLRALPDVDSRRVALVGHSFGGSITLVMMERDTSLRAAVVFGAAAGSWGGSPPVQERLRQAVRRTRAPIFFAHAANDYSVAPGKVLAAEMTRVGKARRLEIYPPVGQTAGEGHNLIFRAVAAWERDVFTFLDERVRPRPK